MAVRSFLRSQLSERKKYTSMLAGNDASLPFPSFLSSAPVWLDAADASTISESGGSVSQWDNKGTLSNLTQATSSLQPTTGVTTLNGLNVIDFNGDLLVNSGVSTDYSFMHNGTDYFFCYVLSPGSLGDDIYAVFGNWNGDNVSNGVAHWIENRSGVSTNGWFFNVANSSSNRVVDVKYDTNFFTSGFNIYSGIVDPDAATADRLDYYRNATQGTLTNADTGSPSTGSPRDNFSVGSYNPTIGNLIGSLAELIIVSGADATESNRQEVVDYLNAKWSVF